MVFLDDTVVESALNKAIEELYIPHFMSLGLNASGQWKENVEAKGHSIWGMDYTEFLAKGRGANHNQDPEARKKWVGWAVEAWVKDWLRDKGLDLDPYAVAMNIAIKGTTIKEKGGTDILEFLQSDVFLNRVGELLAIELQEEILKDLRMNVKLAFTR